MSAQEPTPSENSAPTAVRRCPSCGGQNTYRGIEEHPGPLSVCAHCGHEWEHAPDEPDAPTSSFEPRKGSKLEPTGDGHTVRVWTIDFSNEAERDKARAAMERPGAPQYECNHMLSQPMGGLPGDASTCMRCTRATAADPGPTGEHIGTFTAGVEQAVADTEDDWEAARAWLLPHKGSGFNPPSLEGAFVAGCKYKSEARHKPAPTPGPTAGAELAKPRSGEDYEVLVPLLRAEGIPVTGYTFMAAQIGRASMRSPEPPPDLPDGWQRAHPESPGREGNLAAIYDGWREVVVTEDGRMVFAMSPGLLDAPVPVVLVALSDAGLLPGARSPDVAAEPKIRRMEGRKLYQDHVFVDGERRQVYVCYNCNIETTSNPCVCGAFVRALFAERDDEDSGAEVPPSGDAESNGQ